MTDDLLLRPKLGTLSASRFFQQYDSNLISFAHGEMILESHTSFLVATGTALATGEQSPEEVFPKHFGNLEMLRIIVKKTRRARINTGLCTAMDNFLCYVSDIITEVMVKNPDILRSQELVAVEDILRHTSITDFVEWLTEEQVNKLSFKGLPAIAEHIEKRLGLAIHADEDDWQAIRRGVAIRNLLVHRRGVVDRRFMRLVDDGRASIGEIYKVEQEEFVEAMKVSAKIVGDFDQRVVQKFKLETTPCDPSPPED